MNPKSLKLFAYLLLLLAGTLACGVQTALQAALERGDITFVTPPNKAIFYRDDKGDIPQTEVSLNSTFDLPKEARIYINDMGPIPCTLAANTITTCPYLVPYARGVNTLRAEVFKVDNETVVSTKITFNWTPPGPLDKAMQFFSQIFGTDNPLPGYGLVIFLITVITAFALSQVFGKWGAVLAFLLSLIGLAFYFQQTGATLMAGQVLTLIYSIIGIAFVTFLIFTWIKNRGSVHVGPYVRASDGSRSIEMGEAFFLGPADKGPDLTRMGNAASRALIGDENFRRSEGLLQSGYSDVVDYDD